MLNPAAGGQTYGGRWILTALIGLADRRIDQCSNAGQQ